MHCVFFMMFYSAKQNVPDIVGDVLLLLSAYPLFVCMVCAFKLCL